MVKAWFGMLHMACCCGGKFAKRANSSYQTPRAAARLAKILCPGGAGSTGARESAGPRPDSSVVSCLNYDFVSGPWVVADMPAIGPIVSFSHFHFPGALAQMPTPTIMSGCPAEWHGRMLHAMGKATVSD